MLVTTLPMYPAPPVTSNFIRVPPAPAQPPAALAHVSARPDDAPSLESLPHIWGSRIAAGRARCVDGLVALGDGNRPVAIPAWSRRRSAGPHDRRLPDDQLRGELHLSMRVAGVALRL